VDARIVAATNRCLETAVAVGHFREDLFYRLNVYPIVVPPLRERGEDVLQLFEHFAEKFALDDQAPIRLAADAADVLLARAWPGNVRELSNLVERLSIRYPGEQINADMLPPESLRKVQPLQCASIQPFQPASHAASPLPSHPSLGYPHMHPTNGSIWPESSANGFANGSTPQEQAALWASNAQPATRVQADPAAGIEAASLVREGVIDLREHLRQIEVRFIESALEHNNGNVTLAAERLGLRRTTLIEKIKKHEIAYRAN
jgi:sigma-54 specific flagellar transcriptional regulator A